MQYARPRPTPAEQICCNYHVSAADQAFHAEELQTASVAMPMHADGYEPTEQHHTIHQL